MAPKNPTSEQLGPFFICIYRNLLKGKPIKLRLLKGDVFTLCKYSIVAL